jgi:hypothetical protein
MLCTRLGFGTLAGGTLLALTLGGVNPAPAQPAAASQFTGTYTGTTRLAGEQSQVVAAAGPMQFEQQASGQAGRCSPGGPVSLDVHDGRFRLPWSGPQAFNVRISPDGSFYATSSTVPAASDKHMMVVPTLQGRVSGASLVADYGTRWCHYRLEATRS